MSADDTNTQQDRAAYTINEWCQEARISPPLFYKKRREGHGPRVVNWGRRTIVVEPPRAFYARLAREAASEMEAV
jgi:hypothetical protein